MKCMNSVHVYEDFIILQLNNRQSVLKFACLCTENIVLKMCLHGFTCLIIYNNLM
jgi:hypothetical protein